MDQDRIVREIQQIAQIQKKIDEMVDADMPRSEQVMRIIGHMESASSLAETTVDDITSNKIILTENALSLINHELKTPLVPIKAYSDMLIGGEFGPLNEEQRRRIVMINTSARHLQQKIEILLDRKMLKASMDDAGHARAEKEQQDMILEKIKQMFSEMQTQSDSEIRRLNETLRASRRQKKELIQEKLLLSRVVHIEEQKNVHLRKKNAAITVAAATILGVVPLVITVAVTVLSFSLVQTYEFKEFSAREASIFQPILYTGIGAIIVLSAAVAVIGQKLARAKSQTKTPPGKSQDGSGAEGQMAMLQKRLARIERAGRRATYVIVLISLAIGGTVGYYLYVNVYAAPGQTLTSGRYTIEDVRGNALETWAIWYVDRDEPLHVDIVNANLLPKDEIDSIKNAILSDRAVRAEPGDEASAIRYEGWAGAIGSVTQDTQNPIPKNFIVEESDTPAAEIIVILSEHSDPEGAIGLSKSIADGEQHQILKSFITIYDVENLDSNELEAVVRHEFGHALGLPYSDSEEDGAHYRPKSDSYISECTVDSVVSLYNEREADVTCG